MNDLITILVPFYNVEKYIKQCIESIINQTYKNLEIILIDDGSTDNSLKICKEFQKIDSRINIIKKKHKGVSSSRNIGIKIAHGEYIMFIDSDDFVSKNFVKELYSAVLKNNTLVAQCDVDLVNEVGKHLSYAKTSKKNTVNGNELIYELYSTDNSTQDIVIWNKIYHNTVIKKYKFPENKICEDEFIIPQILYDRIVTIVNKSLYKYRQRKNSLTHTFNQQRLDIVLACEKRNEFYKTKKNHVLYNLSLKEALYQTELMLGYTDKNDTQKVNYLLKWYKKFAKEMRSVNIHFKGLSNSQIENIIGIYDNSFIT